MPPVLCNYCESSDHDAYTYPFHAYVDATCASFETKMTNQMIETTKAIIAVCSQCSNKNRRLIVSLILV